MGLAINAPRAKVNHMIISLLDNIGQWNNQGDKTSLELFDYLHSLNIRLFDPVYHQKEAIETSPDEKVSRTKYQHQDPLKIITYILYAYSEDSPYLVLGANPEKEKEEICARLDVPDHLWNDLIHLEDSSIKGAVLDYISMYGTPQWWTDLKLLEIQYQDAAKSIAKGITKYNKDTGEYEPDHTGQSRAIKSYEDFGKRLNNMREEIKQNFGSQLRFLNSISEELKGRNSSNGKISWENSLKK